MKQHINPISPPSGPACSLNGLHSKKQILLVSNMNTIAALRWGSCVGIVIAAVFLISCGKKPTETRQETDVKNKVSTTIVQEKASTAIRKPELENVEVQSLQIVDG
jgi:hypothetical protein